MVVLIVSSIPNWCWSGQPWAYSNVRAASAGEERSDEREGRVLLPPMVGEWKKDIDERREGLFVPHAWRAI